MDTTAFIAGQDVLVQDANGLWEFGTITRVSDGHGVTVAMDDGGTARVQTTTRIMDINDATDATPMMDLPDGYTDITDVPVDGAWGRVIAERWTVTTDDDGRQTWTNANGRVINTLSTTDYAPNGYPVTASKGTKGSQGIRVPRSDVATDMMICGRGLTATALNADGSALLDADGNTVQITRGCGQETSVRQFPTDGSTRLDIHRGCNSNRGAVAGWSRVRVNMAN